MIQSNFHLTLAAKTLLKTALLTSASLAGIYVAIIQATPRVFEIGPTAAGILGLIITGSFGLGTMVVKAKLDAIGSKADATKSVADVTKVVVEKTKEIAEVTHKTINSNAAVLEAKNDAIQLAMQTELRELRAEVKLLAQENAEAKARAASLADLTAAAGTRSRGPKGAQGEQGVQGIQGEKG